MGRKATFVKSRFSDIHRRNVQRTQRSVQLRQKRLGEDVNARRVQKVVAHRALPGDENRLLLQGQFAQACRVPSAAEDIILLVRSPNSAAIVEAFSREVVAIANGTNAAVSLEEILTDEYGAKVVSAILTASTEAGPSALPSQKSLAAVVVQSFTDAPRGVFHHVKGRVLSAALSVCDTDVALKGLAIFQAQCTTYASVVEAITDRHAAPTLVKLLQICRDDTSRWLSDKLHLAAHLPALGKKSAAKASEKDGGNHAQNLKELIEHQVAAVVINGLVCDYNRWHLFSALGVDSLMASKRFSRFTNLLLDFEGDRTPDATEMADAILFGSASGTLCDASFDPNGNFTVQKVIGLLLHVDGRVSVFHKRLMDILEGQLLDMCRHPIANHVVVALLETTSKLAEHSTLLKGLAKAICRPERALELVRDKHGSLVIRKLVECCGGSSEAVGFLLSIIDQHVDALMYDQTGNLVVQQLLRCCGPQQAAQFLRKHLKGSELVQACQHPSASHVVHTLFDCVDPPTFAEICGALKPHVVNLARHVNGRFIVEKMIPSQRDVREALLRQFVPLAMSKGTQHVLVALFEHLDATTRKNFVQNILLPQFKQLSKNGTSSIVIQKLLQSKTDFLAMVRKSAAGETGFLNELNQDFFGKFVVQIVTGSQ